MQSGATLLWYILLLQIAALWTLRNFGLVELYRTRMATMGVMPLCVNILEDMHQPISVHHAAAAVLQVQPTHILRVLLYMMN
jgi:hypothetical protein